MLTDKIKNNAEQIQQIVKWVVYTLLLINFGFYIAEDWDRAMHALGPGSTLFQWTTEFSTSIDELGWFILLFMFELETYALSDQVWKGWVAHAVRGVRVLCIIFIAHTVVAYTSAALEIQETRPVENVTDLCDVAGSGTSFVRNLEYTEITPENCAGFSSASEFFWTSQTEVLSDREGLLLERYLAWVDVGEAIVWLLILLSIEIIVRLQDKGISSGRLFRAANSSKIFLYLLLFAAAAYWGWLGHWLYVWDELLWIGGFAAIEMNVAEWREELEATEAG